METIFWISVTLFLIALISVIVNVRKHRKLYANKNKTIGFMDDNSLSEGEVRVQLSEQPFVDVY